MNPVVEPEIRDSGAAGIGTVRDLFREYQEFLGVDLCFQGFDEELATLPGAYAPPAGALLLAMADDNACGCVGMRPIGGDQCEMKRLYVRPGWRGHGLGRRLADAVMTRARNAGYHSMVLDTLEVLRPAIALYRSIGFSPIEGYYDNPLPGVSYWRYEFAESDPPR
jgi:putative acetyltransferase